MILLFTHTANDLTILRLCEKLQEKGGYPIVVDPQAMESLSAFTITTHEGRVDCTLQLGSQSLSVSDVRSVFLWRSWQRFDDEPVVQPLLAKPREWAFYKQEWLAFYRGVVLTLAYHGVFCVNPPPFNTAFEEKCCQLFLAAQLGLSVPDTCYTTRLPVARSFITAYPGPAIYKPFRTYAHLTDGPVGAVPRKTILYTRQVDPDDLTEPPHFIPTPSIFQPYIEKAYELRIVIIGRQIFACSIDSQESERTRQDWRRYDFAHTTHQPYDLPVEIAEKLLLLMDRLQLVFGSIDMIVTPDGRYVFLEINPTGQFDWIARLTGLPLYDVLADLLLHGATPSSS